MSSPSPVDANGRRRSSVARLQMNDELQKLKDMHHGAAERRRGSVFRRQTNAKDKLKERLNRKKKKAVNKVSAGC
jgi:hypothetical protein